MPIVLAGARMVAKQALKEHGKRIPWEEDGEVRKEVKEIDRVQGGGLWVSYLLVVAFAVFVWMVDFRGEIGGWDWSKLGGGFVGDW